MITLKSIYNWLTKFYADWRIYVAVILAGSSAYLAFPFNDIRWILPGTICVLLWLTGFVVQVFLSLFFYVTTADKE